MNNQDKSVILHNKSMLLNFFNAALKEYGAYLLNDRKGNSESASLCYEGYLKAYSSFLDRLSTIERNTASREAKT